MTLIAGDLNAVVAAFALSSLSVVASSNRLRRLPVAPGLGRSVSCGIVYITEHRLA